MNNQMMNTCHDMSIAGLMYFNPAKLFHKIYALPWYQETLQTWTSSLEFHKGESILEVGCATGELAKYLASRGAIALGVDKSSRMLKMANAYANSGVHFELASALDLPFESNHFDYAISASLINIISEPEIAMREMARVCKPGGKVSVLVPQAGMTDRNFTELVRSLNLQGFSLAALSAWHRRAPKMQSEKLLAYFENTGLHDIKSTTYLNGLVVTVTGTI